MFAEMFPEIFTLAFIHALKKDNTSERCPFDFQQVFISDINQVILTVQQRNRKLKRSKIPQFNKSILLRYILE